MRLKNEIRMLNAKKTTSDSKIKSLENIKEDSAKVEKDLRGIIQEKDSKIMEQEKEIEELKGLLKSRSNESESLRKRVQIKDATVEEVEEKKKLEEEKEVMVNENIELKFKRSRNQCSKGQDQRRHSLSSHN